VGNLTFFRPILSTYVSTPLAGLFALKLLGRLLLLLKRSISKVHPQSKRCYAWLFTENGEPKYTTVLELFRSIRRKTLSKWQLRLKGLAFNKTQFRIKKRNAICHWRGIGVPRSGVKGNHYGNIAETQRVPRQESQCLQRFFATSN
jgi:hypothetical protein